MKGVSLLELLRFYAEKYLALAKELYDLEVCLYVDHGENELAKRDRNALSLTSSQTARGVLGRAKENCEAIGLTVCSKHVDELYARVNQGFLGADEVKALHLNIDREVSCHFYVGIPEDRREAYCESLKGWEHIAKAFPRATEDIEEMNKCYALCRYSAAVFHSLLVVEHGLVALGKKLNVTDPKEGWDASCRKLEDVAKAGHKKNTTGINFSFLEQINTCIQSMKLAWRNKVSHATGKPIIMGGGFAPYVAQDTISATRNFMNRLCEAGIKEPDWIEELEMGPPPALRNG